MIIKNGSRILVVGIGYGLRDLGVGVWFRAGVKNIAIIYSVQTGSGTPIHLFILSREILPVVKQNWDIFVEVQLIKHLLVRRLYVVSIETGFYYEPTATGNETSIYRPDTTIQISTYKLQQITYATSPTTIHQMQEQAYKQRLQLTMIRIHQKAI
jgi:hypothetical protein